MLGDGGAVLAIKLENKKPVDLLDLTTSFAALAESFREYANEHTGEPLPDNVRLYVQEMTSGSIIAKLTALADQASWTLKHAEVLAGFVTNLNDVVGYFLDRPGAKAEPSKREAEQVSQILEPVAKDGGSQIIIQAMPGSTVTVNQFQVGSLEANAIQNRVRQFVGPALPASEVRTDELLVLEQVKNAAGTKTGDRGIIERIWPRAVKLLFANEDGKKQVLNLDGNPFQHVFLVDVDVRAVDGKPQLYRVINVKEVMPRS